MAKLGQILATQLNKLGIQSTDALKPLLELDTEVPEDVAKKLDTGLLTIEAAKSNSEVLKTVRANVLDGVDQKMNEIITEMALHPGDDFVNSKNTFEKIPMLGKLIHESTKKAAGKGSNEESVKLEADLRKQIKEANDKLTNLETTFKEQMSAAAADFELKTMLAGKEYSLPKEMDKKLVLKTAMDAIDMELKSKGFVRKVDENGQMVILHSDGRPAYNEKSEPVKVDTFIDGALARNNMLKINDPNPQPNPPGPGPTHIPVHKTGNATVLAEIEKEGFFE